MSNPRHLLQLWKTTEDPHMIHIRHTLGYIFTFLDLIWCLTKFWFGVNQNCLLVYPSRPIMGQIKYYFWTTRTNTQDMWYQMSFDAFDENFKQMCISTPFLTLIPTRSILEMHEGFEAGLWQDSKAWHAPCLGSLETFEFCHSSHTDRQLLVVMKFTLLGTIQTIWEEGKSPLPKLLP